MITREFRKPGWAHPSMIYLSSAKARSYMLQSQIITSKTEWSYQSREDQCKTLEELVRLVEQKAAELEADGWAETPRSLSRRVLLHPDVKKPAKYWLVWIEEAKVLVMAGEASGRMSTTYQPFFVGYEPPVETVTASPQEAEALAAKLLKEKVAEGYREWWPPAKTEAPAAPAGGGNSSRREFHFEDASSAKFWAIELKGKEFAVEWGRIGSNGQSQTKRFTTEAEAKKQYDKLVQEKTSKGYKEVGAALQAVPSQPDAEAEGVRGEVRVNLDAEPDDDTLEHVDMVRVLMSNLSYSLKEAVDSRLLDLAADEKIPFEQKDEMTAKIIQLHEGGMPLERAMAAVLPQKKKKKRKAKGGLTIDKIEVADRARQLATTEELEYAEAQLGARFPKGYREFVTTIGGGVFRGADISILLPRQILARLTEWRERIGKYWFWENPGNDAKEGGISQASALRGYLIGDTSGGHELVVDIKRPDLIFVLPHEQEHSILAGQSLLEAVDMVRNSEDLSGEVIAERRFSPFESVPAFVPTKK